MVAFYVWPALAVGLVVAMRASPPRRAWGIAVAVAVTVCSETHLAEWPWWGIVNGGIVVLLMAGIPSRPRRPVPMNTDVTDAAAVRDHPPALVGARP
jgi:hypothetical protein